MTSRKKELIATIVTEKGFVLREQYHQLITAEIESVLQRMKKKGEAFPEFDRYCAHDEDALAHSWFALAIDPTGIVRARGAAAHRADAAALAWIHTCVDPEKPSWRQVSLDVPKGWSFKCVTELGEDDDDAHQAHSSPVGPTLRQRRSHG